jgi:NitT/TauT family transport system permease protein
MKPADAALEAGETRGLDDASDRARPLLTLFGQIALGVALLGVWQLASGRWVDPFFVSSPLEVAKRLLRWSQDGTLLNHASYTFRATGMGFLLGAVIGFTVGFLLGRSETAARICDPYITAIYCLPKIALAPLFLLWFGIGIESKIAMAAAIVFFLVFLNTFAGVRAVERIHLDTVRIMGGGAFALLRYVVLPSAAAWVLTGLKISVPYALIGAVVSELISSNRGIGFLIAQAQGLFDTTGVFTGLIVLATAGVVLNGTLKAVERRVLRWRG